MVLEVLSYKVFTRECPHQAVASTLVVKNEVDITSAGGAFNSLLLNGRDASGDATNFSWGS